MSKILQTIDIINREKDKVSEKQLRQHCIPIIAEEVGMSIAGASTYFNNARNMITGNIKPKEQREQPTASDFVGTGVDPTKLPIYSVVELQNNIAVYCRSFFNKNDAINEGKRLGQKVVLGVQVIGKPFGIVEKGTTGAK